MYDPELIERLRRAERITVLTGAGVSAESGIPTFRDRQVGLWQNFDAADLATPAAYERDPALVWGWYEWRRALVLRAEPNAAHRAIAALERLVPRFALITQNVDDLHERAGSAKVLHLHGRLAAPYCAACHMPYALGPPLQPAGGAAIEPPRCGACAGRVRPGVVWFGETLPQAEWRSALEAARSCDAFICVGTSAVVQPAASLIAIAGRAGALTVQVNIDATVADDEVRYALRGPAGIVLPPLVAEVWGTRAVG